MDIEIEQNPDSRKKLAILVTRLFDVWRLNAVTQLNLLGLSITSRASLKNYRQGRGLSARRDRLDRVGWLLAIHKALRLLYPHNDELRAKWVTLRSKAFNNCSPLEVMTEQGLIGIVRVARYLDYRSGR